MLTSSFNVEEPIHQTESSHLSSHLSGPFGVVLICLLIATVIFYYLGWRGVLRAITQAVIKKYPASIVWFGFHGRPLDRLVTEINELIAENNELRRLRTGHLAQLDATLGSLQEAVLIIDANNTILLANKALRSIFPDSASALHQRFEHVIHSATFLEYVTAVRAGTAHPQQEIAFTTPRDTRWVEVTGATIPPADGTNSGPWTLFVLHDITRQKKLEAVRKDFVANVSHELRTPLSLVKGCAETLVDGHRDMPVADREKFLLTIQRHSERLDTLIEDLLTLSRLESPSPGLQPERVNFPQFATAIIADCRARPVAAAHTLNLAIAPDIGEVNIDPRKLTQVFENLIGNALKYTPPGTRIDITATLLAAPATANMNVTTKVTSRPEDPPPATANVTNMVTNESVTNRVTLHSEAPVNASAAKREIEVCVRDNGPGIPAADLPHIFERFYRVDKARSRETGGTGLGLSIVKHIVQLHGGRVRVESDHGRGAAFYFTLPA